MSPCSKLSSLCGPSQKLREGRVLATLGKRELATAQGTQRLGWWAFELGNLMRRKHDEGGQDSPSPPECVCVCGTWKLLLVFLKPLVVIIHVYRVTCLRVYD